jgi:hypothetical protein
MLGKMLSRLRKYDWDRLAARTGALASRHKAWGARALFAAGFGLVVLLVHREVFSFIVQRPSYKVPGVRAAVAPPWSGGQGEELVRVEGQGSIFDPELIGRVGRSFEQCAWVRKVTSVERVFPDQVRVRFEYRRPHVAVRRENGFVLVDAEAVRLPGVYAQVPPCDRAAVVGGVTAKVPEAGRRWEDAALAAGLAMADLAHEDPLLKKLGVKEVDVANHGGRLDPRRSELQLVTGTGCQLAWGRAAKDARFGEPTVEEKLDSLRGVLAAYPGLQGLKRVSVHFPGQKAVELVEPYAQTPSAPAPAPQHAPLPRRR